MSPGRLVAQSQFNATIIVASILDHNYCQITTEYVCKVFFQKKRINHWIVILALFPTHKYNASYFSKVNELAVN